MIVVQVKLLDIGIANWDVVDYFYGFVVEVNWTELIVIRIFFCVLLEAMAQH